MTSRPLCKTNPIPNIKNDFPNTVIASRSKSKPQNPKTPDPKPKYLKIIDFPDPPNLYFFLNIYFISL